MKIDKKGFSFIELLVTIAIIGILIAIAIPIYSDAVREAKKNAQLENMRIVKTSLEMYYLKNKSYPVDAWSFTTYFFYNPNYFPERLICPYNNQPYEVIQWQSSYTNWDDIWNWVESTNNYHKIYYKSDPPSKNYSLTYYSR